MQMDLIAMHSGLTCAGVTFENLKMFLVSTVLSQCFAGGANYFGVSWSVAVGPSARMREDARVGRLVLFYDKPKQL